MSISSFFHLNNQNVANQTNQTNQTSSSQGASSYHTTNALSNLSTGQTISGEVVAVRNGEIDVALDPDTYITAKLDRDMNLAVGQTLTFEVKSTSGNRIALSPLYENMTQNPTISNAILAANLPLNGKTASMVFAMMENGMSIGKEALQGMYRQIMNNPDISGETIVQMNRLQIPVTPENITEFDVYKNYEHSIMEAAGTIAEDLIASFQEIVQGGDGKQAATFLQEMLQIFGDTSTLTEGKTDTQQNVNENLMENGSVETVNRGTAETAVNDSNIGNTETLENSSITGSTGNLQNSSNLAIAENIETHNIETRNIETHNIETQNIETQNIETQNIENKNNKEGTGTESITGQEISQITGKEVLTPREAANLSLMLEQLGVDAAVSQAVKNGTMEPEKILETLVALLKEQEVPGEQLQSLLQSKEVTSLLRGQVERQWLIRPEEVAKEGKVEELYQRIQQQTAKLADSISGLVRENSALAKSVNQLSTNVEFMNQLNQTFTYVQLPLKMSDGKAHGELYVYTNKKNLAKKDGSVSALLHLNMEHLGALDVYVAMENQNVSTKFYLEKESYLDFIAENIHLLNERLEKRGYSLKAEFIQKESTTNILDEMIQQGNTNNGMVISKYAFDARA